MVGLGGTGLSILPRRGWRSLALACLLGLGFGLWMGLADRSIFAEAIPSGQRAVFGETALPELIPQLAIYIAFQEVILRLIAMTLVVWLVKSLSGRTGPAVMWSAIALTALGFWPLVASAYLQNIEWSALAVLREIALHIPAGLLWGWLYWRHGWLAALAGHYACYVTMVPLLIA